MTIRVGMSGWQYKDWKPAFYPPRCPLRLWLETYARSFDTVEVNNAFYRLPERTTFERWRDQTPDGFVMAVKASQYLTHRKRLNDPAEPVARLLDRAAGLGDRLGPVLLQLPPNLPVAADRLDATLACFPPTIRVAVEPRHQSWWTAEVRAVLERHGAALCWADRGEEAVTPTWQTTDWGYLRLHEGRGQPAPRYRPETLDRWVSTITHTYGERADVFVYFNNDRGAAAIHDGGHVLRQLGVERPRLADGDSARP